MNAAVRYTLCGALMGLAAAHSEDHNSEANIQRLDMDQFGMPSINCASAGASLNSGSAVATITVSNDIKESIKLTAVNKDRTVTACDSSSAGVKTIDGTDFRLTVNADIQYVMVMAKDGSTGAWKDVHEIWRSMDGTKQIWPKTVQIWEGARANNDAKPAAGHEVSLTQILKEALFGENLDSEPCGSDTRCTYDSRHCAKGVSASQWVHCCNPGDAIPGYSGDVMLCCPPSKPIAIQYPPLNHWKCVASSFRR